MSTTSSASVDCQYGSARAPSVYRTRASKTVLNQYAVSKLELYMMAAYVFIAFFEPFFNQLVGNYLKYYIILLMAIIIERSWRCKRVLKIDWMSALYIVWFMYKLVSIYWTPDPGYSAFNTYFLSQIGMVGFLVVANTFAWSRKDISLLVRMIFAASFLFGILTLFYAEPYVGISNRYVLTLAGVQLDPNNCCALLSPGLAIACYWFFKGEKRLLSAVAIVVNMYAILLSGSRGGMLALVAIVFLAALIPDGRQSVLRRFGTFVCVIVAAFVFVFLISSVLDSSIADRLLDFDSYSEGSGRDVKYSLALSVIAKNPLFGLGWGSYYAFSGSSTNGVENTFLEMMCDVGVLGTALFCIPMAVIMVSSWRDRRPLALLLLLAGVLSGLTIGTINKRYFWNGIVLAMMIHHTEQAGGQDASSSSVSRVAAKFHAQNRKRPHVVSRTN